MAKFAGRSARYNWRYIMIMLGITAAVLGLLWRCIDLTICQRHFLLKQGNARTVRDLKIPAYRGMITDRNGEPLAVSSPVLTTWINPQEFSATDPQLNQLASILKTTPDAIKQKVARNAGREFIYLQRQSSPSLGPDIQALDIPGVYFRQEYRRYYPSGEVSSQILGFTNIDDHGQEGLELLFDPWLRGEPGKKRVVKDRLGRVISELKTIKKPRPGKNLTLSIDKHLQFAAYNELKKTVTKAQAESASMVLLSVKTGEVLAMANYPSFNPNNRHRGQNAFHRNRVVTDVFEPGSTIKAFSVAAALASGQYTPESIVNTAPGWWNVDGNRVQDVHHGGGPMDVTTILKRSSNVGISKLILSIPEHDLPQLLSASGFGERTQSGFPGEVPGDLPRHNHWNPFVLATLSFGYSMTSTPLQLAKAFSIFASDGISRPVTLLKVDNKTRKPATTRVIHAKIAKQILTMLESVVEGNGTARRARIPGYRVAGKTGTVRIVGEHGYEEDRHDAIFVGLAPVSDPQFVIVVYVHDPQGQRYYSSQIAAPAFAHVMKTALQRMDVAPDNLETVNYVQR